MDLLKQELQKKRKAVELAKKSSDVGRIGDTSDTGDEKKGKRVYMKAADVRRFQEKREEEEKRNATLAMLGRTKKRKTDKCSNENLTSSDRSDKQKSSNKSSKENRKSDNDKKEAKQSETKKAEETDRIDDQKMSSSDVTKALRELGIPVWLFGESSDDQRLERLREARESRKAAMAGLSEMDEFKLGSGHGIRNPFIGKDKDDDLGIKPKQNKNESGEKSNADNIKADTDTNDPHKAIHGFFKSLLRQWEDDLANRPDSIKRTAAGKNETKTLKQCKDYIRPLFKLCKNRTLEENIMGSLLKIVNFCKEGEFVKANDSYMDVAIGRAAWPIGVTMVGIHQRTGRERINADKVAHVMNSELQRKYLTSVKRLMTYSQKKRPDVDPSKKVTNV
eukprot:CAMPEP_0203677066 /NCGR_PEP_ID=MMETSP0090-20130426/26995_1 /ASSEMBLY_ACC=CAM_ASM_001088 /TAXON_ID=426623 /ORGANISM="Chaetoceros affinis, Strain CCMP159" /LENGTH=391 /DNA_ID=CAMNT_0050543853 /DNA_START=16 /DNA_END=1191 /DNA_ORIENTATION=+